MSLSYPLDILADWPGWNKFQLMARIEKSRTAGGRDIPKELGSALWRMTATSKVLKPNTLDHWMARLDALEDGIQTFKGYPLSRCYPILYPNGSWPVESPAFDGTTAQLHTVDSNRKSIRVTALPAGFVFSIGDMLSINDRDLHRVVESATADGSGLTPLFEVRPHIWPGIEGSTSPVTPVIVYKPNCIMAIDPGSIQAQVDDRTGRGSITFDATEAR